MVSIDATARAHDGVTLVTAILEGGPVPTRVALANRLDGPVWPPRRMGEPESGWDDEGYEGVVPAGESVALGYACPAPPDEPPIEVVATERVDWTDASAGDPGARDPRAADFDSASDVLRGLGSPAPPRDAVALPAPAADGDGEVVLDVDRSNRSYAENGHGVGGGDVGGDRRDDGGEHLSHEIAGPNPDLPEPVAGWLDDAEARIERAEAFDEVTDVPTATEAVRRCGSLDAVAGLHRRRAVDAERLREIAKRANALAYRAESATIPLDALSRLA